MTEKGVIPGVYATHQYIPGCVLIVHNPEQ